MRITKNTAKWSQQAGFRRRVRNRKRWEGRFTGWLVLLAMGLVILPPFRGRSAAPGLQLGGFTNFDGKTYVTLVITNSAGTNSYEIHTRAALTPNFPWVRGIIGTNGQTNFSIEIGPEQAYFFRALDCVDCDGDMVPNWKDGNPDNTNVLALSITILSPTNGATIY